MKEVEGQVIQFIGGSTWGVTPEGKTVYVGTEEDVRVVLANPKKHLRNPVLAGIISLERQLLKQGEMKDRKEQKKLRVEKEKRAESLGMKLKKPRETKNRA